MDPRVLLCLLENVMSETRTLVKAALYIDLNYDAEMKKNRRTVLQSHGWFVRINQTLYETNCRLAGISLTSGTLQVEAADEK